MAIRKTSRKTARRSASNLKMSRRRTPARGMTVQEAGRLGGLVGGRKGGLAVKKERGIEFFQEIGRLGGQRVRDLIAAGRKATSRKRHARRQAR
jgi:general stress protein YciG